MSSMMHNNRNFHSGHKSRKKRSAVASFFSSLLLLLALICAIAAVLITIFLKDITETLPSTRDILNHEPSLATTVYDRNDKVVTQLFQENRTWVRLDNISPWMVKAILAAEDSSFYEHSGIRPVAIVRALFVDLLHMGAKQGASTITQQLARNLFLSNEKTIIRKVKEIILALRLERIYTKDQLLEMYLNTIYMGHGAYGVEAAAKIYFGKTPADLAINESAMLAGLVAAPEKYSPFRNNENSQTRKAYVMRRMLDLDWMSKADYDAYIDKEPKLAKRSKRSNSLTIDNAPYFVSHILFKQLLPTYGTDMIYRGGLKIYTTLDLDLQKKAEQIVSKMKHEGALVALDPNTGEILALVGGRNFDKSKFNRATQAFRQPGSAFKPIVFTCALEQGYRGIDHILDAPLLFPNGWSPGNYTSNKYDGEVTLITALAKSINTTAVRLAQIDGIGNITNLARRVGITTQYLPDDLSMALGTASLTPLELLVAYSTFANNGYLVEPYAIKEIISQRGESLEQNGPKLTNALSQTTAVSMRSMLQQVTSWGTGAKAKIEGYEVFGKTGTSNDWTDAWFIGGVPGLVVVVYVGNDDHKPLGGHATGAVAALPVWKEFVSYAVTKLNLSQSFTIPDDAEVEAVRVCRTTGFIAAASCPATTLLLPIGQAPTSKCPWHGGSLAEAQADYNAPQLLLAPIDEDETTVNTYVMRLPGEPVPVQTMESGTTVTTPETVKKPVTVPQKKAVAKEASKVPQSTAASTQKKVRTPDEVEARYQELLKQYKLVD